MTEYWILGPIKINRIDALASNSTSLSGSVILVSQAIVNGRFYTEIKQRNL